jgi:hypothetical protein
MFQVICPFMIQTKKYYTILIFTVLLSIVGKGVAFGQAIDWKAPNHWVDSILASMSEDEKITQLMTIAVWTQRDQIHEREIERLITDYKVGGLMFMKGGPVKQANLCNR